MDASYGQAGSEGINWRGADKAGPKKEKKKAHWLVAKEAGKRVNGSQKRKKRRQSTSSAAEAAVVPHAGAKKAKPTEREAAAAVASKTPEEQRDFLWNELKTSLGDDGALMPPATAFISARVGDSASFADCLKDALEQCKRSCWTREVERTPPKHAKPGRPRVVVVTSAAIRCVDLINDIRSRLTPLDDPTQQHPVVAKLWAKHMRVEEQKDFLRSHYCGIVVGTPNRLGKLIADEALSLKKCRLLVLDCATNVKGQTIFNVVDTRADLFAFLGACCLEGLRDGSFRISLV